MDKTITVVTIMKAPKMLCNTLLCSQNNVIQIFPIHLI